MSSRKRLVTGALSLVFAGSLAIAVYGRSCNSESESSPVGTVALFLAATRSDDRGQIVEYLSPETVEALQSAANRASELSGGSRRFDVVDMISLQAAGVDREPPELVLLSRQGDRAMVAIRREGEAVRELALVRVAGRWRIDLVEFANRDGQ